MKPSLLILAAVVTLGGCDLLGDDYDSLAPGTFRFRADGKVYTGTARFYPETGGYTNEPTVYLISTDSIPLLIRGREFLSATQGTRFEGSASFRPGGARFASASGSTTITGTADDGLSGRFHYDMHDVSYASGPSSITVRGGFNAVRVAD